MSNASNARIERSDFFSATRVHAHPLASAASGGGHVQPRCKCNDTLSSAMQTQKRLTSPSRTIGGCTVVLRFVDISARAERRRPQRRRKNAETGTFMRVVRRASAIYACFNRVNTRRYADSRIVYVIRSIYRDNCEARRITPPCFATAFIYLFIYFFFLTGGTPSRDLG